MFLVFKKQNKTQQDLKRFRKNVLFRARETSVLLQLIHVLQLLIMLPNRIRVLQVTFRVPFRTVKNTLV